MSVAVVGSIAFDSITTPFGSAERELGGSAVHASLAAALFTQARIVGTIGDDFRQEQMQLLADHGIVTSDIEMIPGKKTFAWRGRYGFDLSFAHTEQTDLNVFESWKPKLSKEASQADTLFMASMDPEIQLDVHRQWEGKRWCALDSIGYWIQTKREPLIAAIERADIVMLNDDEVRAITGKPVLLAAARELKELGPQAVVVKHGAYGCSLLTEEGYFALPGYALEELSDPTGAGDAFAGAFLGCLDLFTGEELTESILRRAMTYGAVVASFCVEEFGARRLIRMSDREMEYRVADFREMSHFEHVDTKQKRREQRRDPTRTRKYEMPKPTAGTQTYGEPEPTSGTPEYDPLEEGEGTPKYNKPPKTTPGTKPYPRPKRSATD